jgi:hypothetical protein
MSSTGALSGTGAGVPSGLGGRKRGHPLESRNKVKDSAVMPPVPRRHGRPPGSRNKKTLEALAAAVAAESAGVASAAIAITTATGVVATVDATAVTPTGAAASAPLAMAPT